MSELGIDCNARVGEISQLEVSLSIIKNYEQVVSATFSNDDTTNDAREECHSLPIKNVNIADPSISPQLSLQTNLLPFNHTIVKNKRVGGTSRSPSRDKKSIEIDVAASIMQIHRYLNRRRSIIELDINELPCETQKGFKSSSNLVDDPEPETVLTQSEQNSTMMRYHCLINPRRSIIELDSVQINGKKK